MHKHEEPITDEEFKKAQSERHTSLTHEYPESPWYQEVYNEFLPYIKEPFLDIGTRSGTLLLGLQSRGIKNVTGLEVTDLALHDQELGRPVVQGDIQKRTQFEDKQFKSATMLHALEHCYDPIGALNEIKRIVDGHIMFIIPAQSFLDYKYAHYSYFGELPEFVEFLKEQGFEVIKAWSNGSMVNCVICKI